MLTTHHHIPLQCFKEGLEPRKGTPKPDEELDDGSGGNRIIICRSCGNRITPASSAISMNGSHKHTFFNPHGYVFELGCFSTAPGTIRMGQASGEFTWFSGHTWQITLCGQCNVHIGWYFQGNSSGSFYGLILRQLAEVEDENES